jgi:hypothetical protein
MIRGVLVLLAFLTVTFLAGCASEDDLSNTNRPAVAGEATPAPATGAQSGWKW